MGTSRGKKEQQVNTAQAQVETAIQAVKPTELETKVQASSTKFLDDISAGKDVKDIEGMSPYYDLYNGAVNAGEAEKYSGGGALSFAENGGNSNLATLLRGQQQARNEQAGAGQLYNALNARRGQVEGNIVPLLMNSQANRDNTVLGARTGIYQSVLAQPEKTPFWQSALLAGIGGASSIATGYAGKK